MRVEKRTGSFFRKWERESKERKKRPNKCSLAYSILLCLPPFDSPQPWVWLTFLRHWDRGSHTNLVIEKALNEVHIARSAVAILHARVSDYPVVTAPRSSTQLAANEDSDYGSPDWAEVVKLFQIAREFLESRKKGSSRLFRILDVGRLPEFESEIKIKGQEYLEQNCADGAKFQFAIFELPKRKRLLTERE